MDRVLTRELPSGPKREADQGRLSRPVACQARRGWLAAHLAGRAQWVTPKHRPSRAMRCMDAVALVQFSSFANW